MIITSQCNFSEQYLVIACGNEQDSLVLGDTIAESILLDIDSNEYVLLKSLKKQKVFQINGAFSGSVELGISQGARSFSSKHFNLIEAHIFQNEVGFQESIFGAGVEKNIPILNLKHGELIVSDHLVLKVKDRKKKFTYKVLSANKILMKGSLNHKKVIRRLHGLNSRKKNVPLEVLVESNLNTLKTNIIYASDKTKFLLNKEEENLMALGLPTEGLLNFYLKNRLYRKARYLAENTSQASPLTRDLMHLLE